MARIAIAGFMHETNTFAPVLTTYEHFEQAEGFPGLTQGAEMLSVFPPANIATGGFIKQAQALGHDIAPVLWCAAVPAGYVTEDAYERIVGMIIDGLLSEVEKGAEAVYLDLHGAMVAQHQQDGEGELLRRLRERIGDEMPVVVSLDLHVNITELMVAHADALIGFRTYPHIDMAETGKRSADHMHMILTEARPQQARAFRKLDFLGPLTGQCTMVDPSKSLYDLVAAMQDGPVSTISYTPGFHPADILECGPAVVAYLSVFVTIFTLIPALYIWRAPTIEELALVFVTAGLATLGHLLMTQGFKVAEMSAIQPIKFVQLVWSALIGLAVFGEVPEIFTWIGAAIIVGSISYIAHREAVARRKNTVSDIRP